MTLNESFQKRITELSKELERAYKEITEKDTKIKENEDEIMLLKNQTLESQKQASILAQQNDIFNLTVCSQTDDLETQRVTIEILKREIEAVTQAQLGSDQEIENLLSEKSRLVNSKFQQFMIDEPKFREIKLPDYFKHSYNFNFEPFYDQVPKSSVLNPNYNENKIALRIKNINSEEPLNTIESHTENHDDSYNGYEENKYIEDDKTPKMPESEKLSQLEKTSSMLKRSTNHAKDSFITELDLNNAFNNAADVIYIFEFLIQKYYLITRI